MPTNRYFQNGKSIGSTSEQRLIEDLVIEAVQIHGHDVYYLPRTSVNPDELFGEDPLQKFTQQYPIEMYMTNVEGFAGNGELFSKFGITVTDQATFVVSKRRWEEAVGLQESATLQLPSRPADGDIIYFPKTGAMFEIKFVKADNPFYQLGRIYVYTLTCELYLYSGETIDIPGDMTAEAGSLASRLNLPDGPLAQLDGTDTIIDKHSDNTLLATKSQEFLVYDKKNPFGDYSEAP